MVLIRTEAFSEIKLELRKYFCLKYCLDKDVYINKP